MTVGRDECLAMVNLVRGRRSFCCRLGKEASIVRFSETGERFFMVVDDKISVHESEDAKIVSDLDNKKRVLCATPGSVRICFLISFILFYIYIFYTFTVILVKIIINIIISFY